MLKANLALSVQVHKMTIGNERCSPRRKTKYERTFGSGLERIDATRNVERGIETSVFGRVTAKSVHLGPGVYLPDDKTHDCQESWSEYAADHRAAHLVCSRTLARKQTARTRCFRHRLTASAV